MIYTLFKIQANDDGESAKALNRLLRSRRVLAVRNEGKGAASQPVPPVDTLHAPTCRPFSTRT